MNAPATPADFARRELSRAELIEDLGFVEFYASMRRDFAAIDDAPGADYALRKMAAYARAAIVARNNFGGDDAADKMEGAA
ncbi:MAG TPA: hypothetical protein VKA03_04445 [Methylovirgula sp.]|nr:hypothetical protein [Methylovirgula sp.]